MKIYFILFLLLFVNSMGQTSDNSLNEALEYDYFNHQYKFIDKDYKIKISSKEFEDIIKKYGFYRNRIANYHDSLAVVTMVEFKNNDHKSRISTNRLAFTYLRLSYYFLITEQEAEKIVKKYEFKKPYQFYEFANDEKNHDNYLKKVFVHLRNKVFKITNDEKVKHLSASKLLSVALRNSPKRVEDYQKLQYERKHGEKPTKDTKLGEGCGKKDCCQLEKVK